MRHTGKSAEMHSTQKLIQKMTGGIKLGWGGSMVQTTSQTLQREKASRSFPLFEKKHMQNHEKKHMQI